MPASMASANRRCRGAPWAPLPLRWAQGARLASKPSCTRGPADSGGISPLRGAAEAERAAEQRVQLAKKGPGGLASLFPVTTGGVVAAQAAREARGAGSGPGASAKQSGARANGGDGRAR
ncbi:unnamed protein product, partial [Prorocentrum cordatum]